MYQHHQLTCMHTQHLAIASRFVNLCLLFTYTLTYLILIVDVISMIIRFAELHNCSPCGSKFVDIDVVTDYVHF